MNRYTNLSFSSLNDLPVLALPWEQFDALLASSQKQWDTFGQMKDMMPKYITDPGAEDHKLYAQYQQKVEDINKKTTEAFGSGDYRKGMQALKQGQTEILREWKPGGMADALQQRYTKFVADKEELDKHTRTFKNPLYKNYWQSKLLEDVRQKDIYNPETRTYKSIGDLNLHGEVDILDEALKAVKGRFEGKDVQFVMSEQLPDVIEKVTVEGQDVPDAMAFLQDFMKQPHIQQAVNIESWNRLQGQNKDVIVADYLNKHKEKWDSNKQAVKDLAEKVDTLSKGNLKERMEAQRILQRNGLYDGAIEGDIGPKTKEGITKLEELNNKEYVAPKITAEEIVNSQIESRYIGAAIDPTKKTTKDLEFGWLNAKLKKQENALKAQNNEILKRAFEPKVPPVIPGEVVGNEISIESKLETITNAKKLQDDLNIEVSKNLKEVLGTQYNDKLFKKYPIGKVAVAIKNTDAYIDKNGNINPAKLKTQLGLQGMNYTDQEISELAKALNEGGVGDILESAGKSYSEAELAKNVAMMETNNLMEVYETETGKSIFQDVKIVKNLGLPGTLPGTGSKTTYFTPEELQKNYEAGNEVVVKQVHEQLNKRLTPDEKKKVTTIGTYYSTTNSDMQDGFIKNMNLNPASFFAISDPKEQERIGLNKDNTWKDPNKSGIVDIALLTVPDPNTGLTEKLFRVKLKNGTTTQVRPQSIQAEALKTLTLQLTAREVNPSTLRPNNIRTYNSLLATAFDDYSSQRVSPNILKGIYTQGPNLYAKVSDNAILQHPLTGAQYRISVAAVSTDKDRSYYISYFPDNEEQAKAMANLELNQTQENIDALAAVGIDAFRITDKNNVKSIMETVIKDKAKTFEGPMMEWLQANPQGETRQDNLNRSQAVLELFNNNSNAGF